MVQQELNMQQVFDQVLVTLIKQNDRVPIMNWEKQSGILVISEMTTHFNITAANRILCPSANFVNYPDETLINSATYHEAITKTFGSRIKWFLIDLDLVYFNVNRRQPKSVVQNTILHFNTLITQKYYSCYGLVLSDDAKNFMLL